MSLLVLVCAFVSMCGTTLRLIECCCLHSSRLTNKKQTIFTFYVLVIIKHGCFVLFCFVFFLTDE